MKLLKMAIMLVVTIPLLSGCWDRTEINDIAIVTAAGVDQKEGEQIELSVQVFIPRAVSGGGSSSGGGSTGSGTMTLVRSGVGRNIAEAASKLQIKLPRKIFWGHCSVFIYSKRIAEEGVRDEMDFLLRYPQPRERAYMYVSKGRASDVLELLPPLERNSGEVIHEISNLGMGMRVTVKDFNMMVKADAGAAIMPFIDILPPREGEQKLQSIPYIVGSAVFKGDKLIGTLSDLATRGVMWIRDEVERATITVEPDQAEGFVSIFPVRQSTTLIPVIEEGRYSIRMRIDSEGDLVLNGTDMNPGEPGAIASMEAAVKAAIRDRIELALQKVQQEMKADIFGFGEAFHRKYPKEWKEMKERWDAEFPQVEVPLDITVFIRRSGMITGPAGVQEEKVMAR
ncbi:Ger(x)C family spore germination protein [Paenibacillus sp. PL2-23]|uniref:Ger(x)C family spore germination protein n=1 Tax=Paenibacillus sp. PL2-23 TaxID=2100729 RepID=UPI0030FB6A8E